MSPTTMGMPNALCGKMKIPKNEIASRLPSKLFTKLMPFQKEGVEYAIGKSGRCLIADEMGLGKTLQAISVAYYYRSEWPLLIIVPSSLRYSWIEEFEKWLPDVDPAAINLIQSGSDASGIASALVTITTFGLLSKSTSNIVREALLNQGFQVTIVDESHYIRNVKTASAKIVVPLIKNANRRILLSGTPALARPVELYPQIDAVCPNSFGSWWFYTNRYCDAKLEWIGKIKRRNINGASNLEELQQKLSSTLMIRREKNEVLTQLPPKQRQRVLFELKDSDIKKEIRKTFEELRPLLKQSKTEAIEVLTGAGSSDVKDLNSLSLIQKLYQLSGEAKIGPAKEYIEMLCDNPNLKFLVFAYHKSMMNGLTQSLYDKKVKFIRIDGDTPPSERPQLVHQFQSDPNTRVAILSILAAGVGLTFTAATVVVFAEMYWTPGMMVQCEDRAHRIGQNSCVAVHYLIAKDTMDEWVWSAVCKKTIVTSTTLSGKKQPMEADAGDKYQIDILSNADAWIPKENETLDLSSYFTSQQQSDQKSILSYFSPSQSSSKRSLDSLSQESAETNIGIVKPVRNSLDSLSPKQANKRQKLDNDKENLTCVCSQASATDKHSERKREPLSPSKINEENVYENNSASKRIIVIESESDGEDFDTRTSTKKAKSVSKCKSMSKSGNGRRKGTKTSPNLKCNLKTLFSQSPKITPSEDPVVLLDSESNMSDNLTKVGTCEANLCPTVVEMGSLNETLSRNDESQEEITNARHVCDTKKTVLEGKNSCDNVRNSAKAFCDSAGIQQSNSKESDTQLNQWSCSVCTFLNYKDLKYCEMCETPKKTMHNKMTHDIAANKCDSAKTISRGIEISNKTMNITHSKSSKNQPDRTLKTKISQDSPFEHFQQKKMRRGKINAAKMNIEASAESPSHSDKLPIDSEDEDPLDSHIEEYESGSEEVISEGSASVNPNALRMAKTLWSFGHSECNRVKGAEATNSRESHENINDGYTKANCWASFATANKEIDHKEEDTADKAKINGDINSDRVESGTEEGNKMCQNKSCSFETNSPMRTPKQYRFRSLNRQSVEKSPLTPPAINGCNLYKKSSEVVGEVLAECIVEETSDSDRNRSLLAESADAISDLRIEGFHRENQKTHVGIVRPDKENRTEEPIEMRAETDATEMEELFGEEEKSGEKINTNKTEKVTRHQNQDAPSSDSRDEARIVNLDEVPVYTSFRYQCSKYTGRIYVLSEDDVSLNINFIPIDVEVGNHDDLPDLLLHPTNLRLVQKFVREWQSLSETKKRLIIKHSRTFVSPVREYEELKSCKTVNTQRHRTKEDTALAAMLKAAEVDGSVRVISKDTGQGHEVDQIVDSTGKGVTQAVNKDGVPLCLNCFEPYKNSLLQKASIMKEENAWSTRFCSLKCSQEYWMKTNNEYCRDKVYEAEHGICQICGFDAHSLFKQVRDTHDLEKRAEVIAKSKMNTLNPKTKQQMVKKPVAGQFWHVDHILPVWEGGGQCDIDNLRTLCIPCHQNVSAKQARKRAIVRRLGAGAGSRDITAFFQKS